MKRLILAALAAFGFCATLTIPERAHASPVHQSAVVHVDQGATLPVSVSVAQARAVTAALDVTTAVAAMCDDAIPACCAAHPSSIDTASVSGDYDRDGDNALMASGPNPAPAEVVTRSSTSEYFEEYSAVSPRGEAPDVPPLFAIVESAPGIVNANPSRPSMPDVELTEVRTDPGARYDRSNPSAADRESVHRRRG